MLWDVVPARWADGAQGDHRGGHEEGGGGGDRPAVPAHHLAGRGGERPCLGPLRLPCPGNRWHPEDTQGERRRVPASPVVGPEVTSPPSAIPGYCASHGPCSPVSCQPSLPTGPACRAAQCLPLPAPPGAVCRQRWGRPVAAPGHHWGAAPAPGCVRHVSPRAGQKTPGGCGAAAPGVPAPGQAGCPCSGPAWAAAPGQEAGAERRDLLQCGGDRRGHKPAAQGGTPRAAGHCFCLGEGGQRGSKKAAVPEAQHILLCPHSQLGPSPEHCGGRGRLAMELPCHPNLRFPKQPPAKCGS